MAKSIEKEKAELIAVLDVSRQDLSGDFDEMSTALNFSRQFGTSFRNHRPRWMIALAAGALAAGFLFFGTRRKPKKHSTESRNRPIAKLLTELAVKGLVTSLAQPALLQSTGKHIEKWLRAHLPRR